MLKFDNNKISMKFNLIKFYYKKLKPPIKA